MIDYSPFWNTLREKRISQYHLIQNGVSTRILDALRKNKNITILTLETLCRLLHCTPDEIVCFTETDS